MTAVPDIKDKTAARYVTVLHDPDATLEMVEEALAWAARAPDNRAALERAQRVLDLCDQQPEIFDELEPVTTRYLPASAYRWLVAASLIMAMVTITMLKGHGDVVQPRPESAASLAFVDRYATAIGETRTIVLPDGSSVIMGGLTKLSVGYRQDVRRLELVEGQALFNVAKDRKRPFVVRSGNGLITARGTEFDIKRDTDAMAVTLVHGVVDVNATNGFKARDVRLRAGMQLHVSAKGKISEPAFVDVRRVLAWREGQLNYEDAKLSTIVADLNRYSPRPITIDDDAVGAIRVSGSIKTMSIDNWLAGLAAAFDISVDRRNPVVIGLRSNKTSAAHETPSSKNL
jgi:transmembrane sensor